MSCLLSLPCRLPVATLSLPCRPPVTLLSHLPCGLPVACLSLPVASLLLSCRWPVVFLSPPCRLRVATLSPSCRSLPHFTVACLAWPESNARLHSPRTTESCSWDDIVARLAKEGAQFEKEAAEVRARGLATSVTCECCFFECPFCIVWDKIDEERNTNAEEPNHDGEETREVFYIAGLKAPHAVLVVLEDFWGSLLDVAWKSGCKVVENLWEVTAQQVQDMFGLVDSLFAARLLPSPVSCWARICCKVLCGECEPWHDY